MHEMAIVDSLFQIINTKVKEHQIKKILKVKLKVGEMTVVEPMTLTACFEVYAQDTVAEGAELVIERVPLQGKCRECKNVFRVYNYNFKCPQCESRFVDIVAGRELYIENLEVEQ
ncbi:hydrogenase nickel incorporation protein hypA [Desulfotomaculum nigrificans CO-1-SRB]|uniref:Hydrogenase maturation factor HypA n=2 Tax=Eubacteriales TaxID=186802 RepID=F6B6H2_DESCC|nr:MULTISPECIES: hydrogenase maturation nickel metallochaperone HypA [Eubacteriales]AEF93243.1 hydrogenase nickel incorporation protein hypA [Desulfotomaculum nigrificans CO-1-SRB]SHF59583.1 hydrogenase nickel incorporation protein HypA/HybF [Desulforamulus putei DSM 12395]